MPLYGYKCDTCGHQFEVRQGIKENPLTECPQCGSPIRRIIYPVGIVFKGSGFYVNDSRNAASTSKPATNGEGANGDKADKKEGAAAPAAASGDKTTAAAAPAGDGAKSASTGASASSGSAPAGAGATSSSSSSS